MNGSTKALDIGNTLIANGYTPLPLVDKGIRIRGWSTADITMQWIVDNWPKNKDGSPAKRSGRFPNTGLRCDYLIAFDIDVLDEALADEIEVLVEAQIGETDFLRVGKWPKRLMLYRCADDSLIENRRKARSGKYGGHQVEVLMGSGAQFAAFGDHPGTRKPYEWEGGKSPLTTSLTDLPPCTLDQATAVLADIEQLLADTGLPRTRMGGLTIDAGGKQFSLTPDTRLIEDGVETTWAELRDTLDSKGVWVDMWRDDGFGDSGACHAFIASGSNEPVIFDFPNDVLHCEATNIDGLADIMPELPDGIDRMFENPAMVDMLKNWVLMSNKECRKISDPLQHYTIDGLRQFKAHLNYVNPNVADPKPVNVVTAWAKDSRALRADVMQMRPDYPDDLFIEEGGKTIFNSYRRPQHPDQSGDIETVQEFMAHLVPDDAEREIFIDWHACKIAHPGRRQHGLFLVTPQSGVGRGTWFQILERLIGYEQVKPVDFKMLIGSGTQGQYNQFMVEAVITVVAESREEGDRLSEWQQRKSAYEHLKNVIDPTASRVLVKRKGVANTIERTFNSFIIASNHVDALAIDPDDRRLIVLSNNRSPLGEDLATRIYAWMDQPGNIGRFYAWLMDRGAVTDYVGQGRPPMTPAKQRMIDSGKSDLDELFDLFEAQAAGDLITSYQFKRFVADNDDPDERVLPEGPKLQSAINKMLAKRCHRISDLDDLRVGKSTGVRPWVMRRAHYWIDADDRDIIRKELLKNGSVSRKAESEEILHGVEKPRKNRKTRE